MMKQVAVDVVGEIWWPIGPTFSYHYTYPDTPDNPVDEDYVLSHAGDFSTIYGYRIGDGDWVSITDGMDADAVENEWLATQFGDFYE